MSNRSTRLNDGDTFEHAGRVFRIKTEPDDCADLPWDNCSPLGEVTPWTRRAKRAGELIVSEVRGAYRFYDYQGAVANLRAQGVAGSVAAKGARQEFERFRGWCNDQWHYIGVIVTLLRDELEEEDSNSPDSIMVWNSDARAYYLMRETEESQSLWGVESDCREYISDMAHELATDICRRCHDEESERAWAANQNIATL